MYLQFLSEYGQAKNITKSTVKLSKNLTFIQYISNGNIMNVTLKHDKILPAEHIGKLITRKLLEIESITFSRA